MTVGKLPANQLAGRVALVTGAASGLGRASACAFARAGARVVVADIEPEGGAETVALIAAAGGEATFVLVDVRRAADVEAMISRTLDIYGRLDCAHNNAGMIAGDIALEEYTEDLWDAILGVNLKGIWLCLKHEIPLMRARGGGAIVNTSSVAGLRGDVGRAAYVASKHGVIGLTRVAALECAAAGIRVNAVCPGWVRTPPTEFMLAVIPGLEQQLMDQAPLGRICTAEEVAEAVVWLCSDAASFVTGHPLVIDGGLLA
ncbi:MAG TPA: glucose 1-dehydrogenase [Thermomicrobiaceae bacterium]|nr:glucose 1-dehydrogenase [Thermomicrobiaceae bacterium]